MKQKKNEMYWVMGFVLAVYYIPVFGKPFAEGPYLGQSPPGPIAQVFAPGLISDTRPHKLEVWPSFSADGNTFCFSRLGYIHIAENTDQGWTRPKGHGKGIISARSRLFSSCAWPYGRCGTLPGS
ncbi:MAG: hypothetical protein AMJ75_08730 [Phycisphaerae bacterium SM1_79]|nr:MAG: hypothetical protein AMJ75_08730 [Phycisphaerae bacterium SM1_79]